MLVLAIDCAASLCAACVYDATAGTTLGREVRDLGKGHAEQLMDVIAAALSAAGKTYRDLDLIAVSIGPGSFTGVRVGVSTARGLALALGKPAAGVSTLDAIASEAAEPNRHDGSDGDRAAGTLMVALNAGRDGVYVGIYDHAANALGDPALMTAAEAAALASGAATVLAGAAAGGIAALLPGQAFEIRCEIATADIETYARLAAARPLPEEKPKPLYLRQPDAKPQAGFILPRRDS